jgi:hypothetical protein
MSGGQLWGFDSIGAIATKKPYGSMAVQETFPAVFSQRFAQMGSPQAYLPSRGEAHAPLAVGDDFQASYHEQKRRDADYMGYAKVNSTRMMNARAFSSPNGYYGMSQPVLGQRKFANETGGVFSLNSARQSYGDAPFHYTEPHAYSHHRAHGGSYSGGVLRTAEGQGYAKARLMDRIAQFNALDANVGNFTPDPRGRISGPTEATESLSQLRQSDSQNVGTQALIELNLLLQGINDALAGNTEDERDVSQFTYKDTTRALALLFRLVPTLQPYEISDIQTLFSDILQKLNGIIANEDGTPDEDYQVALTLTALFEKAHDYIAEFMRLTASTRTDAEKLQISKALVSHLGFAKSLREPREQTESRMLPRLGETATENESLNRRHYDAVSAYDRLGTTTTSSSSSSGRPRPRGELLQAQMDADSSARFSALAPTREDQRADQIQRQSGLGTFDVDVRGAFGNNAGHFYPTGGRDVGYADEAIDGPPEAPFGGPLSPEGSTINVAHVSRGVGAPTVSEGAPDVRGRFDEDTQAFNVEVGRAAPAEGEGPRFTEALPTTREEFDALAKRINALPAAQRPTKDGRPIQVYANSTLTNIRKNFRRRLRF